MVLLSGLLTACSGAEESDRIEAETVSVQSSGADEVSVEVHSSGQNYMYSVSYLANSSCYSAGQVSGRDLGNYQYELVAEVNFTSGICAQAQKEIVFEGDFSMKTSLNKLTVRVLNRRNNQEYKKTLSF